ncbi:MAG TPA: STAS domain-containing protein [Streptosporangiaceae bacterium]|jgi:anti-sigma B factor antagonist|nr:STAS domain-containing protein [Streptosporangiaceae bacterium]
MDDDRFPVEVVNGVSVVAAPEDIDATNSEEWQSALCEAAARGTLVADLSRTEFCDASGLRALLAARKRAEAAGGEVLLVARSREVLRALAITTIDRVIPRFTSLEEALARTSANGPAAVGRANGGPPRQPSASRLNESAS